MSGEVLWHGDHQDKGALIEAAAGVFAAEVRSGVKILTGHVIRLDTRAFHATDGTKLGLGSSAAITVALTGALLASLGDDCSPARVEQIAGRIHRRLQGGEGSGIDVSTSAHGGLGSFAAGTWRPLAMPPLAWRAVWTGEAACTRDLVRRYREAETEGREDWCRASRALGLAASNAVSAWGDAQTASLLEALDAFAASLERLDAAGDLGIYSVTHRALARIAAQSGVCYKPSGAGGGDFGLAFAADESALAGFDEAAGRAGFSSTVPDVSSDGVTVERY